MSADLLRAAADRLDELAGAATPGPWYPVFLGKTVSRRDDEQKYVIDSPGRLVVRNVGFHDDKHAESHADLIATLADPEVGKALAAWLRVADMRHLAGLSGCRERNTARKPNANGACPTCEALTVARLILGGSHD